MNHIKQVWQWVSNHWVMPTPAELVAEELIHAQRSKLRHQSAQEYHTAIVAYNVARIKRLEGLTAKQEVAEPQPEERNFCPRCGKRTADLTVIHTCTPPQETTE